MVDQTKMNGQQRKTSPAVGMGRNLADLSHDLLTLVELQCQLLFVDIAEGKSKSILPLILIVSGCLLALAALPVLLLAFGWMLVNLGELSQHAAFFIVSLSAIALAGGAVWGGFKLLSRAMAVLGRSRQEMRENLEWIKFALKQHGTAQSFDQPIRPVPR